MLLDFDKIEEVNLPNFKGGELSMDARMFFDGTNRIFPARLQPGASIGLHTHDTSSEIIFITHGTATVLYDGEEIIVKEGQCHYCPKGHTHSLMNKSDSEICFNAVVAEQ